MTMTIMNKIFIIVGFLLGLLAILFQLIYSYLDFRKNERLLKKRKKYGKKRK